MKPSRVVRNFLVQNLSKCENEFKKRFSTRASDKNLCKNIKNANNCYHKEEINDNKVFETSIFKIRNNLLFMMYHLDKFKCHEEQKKFFSSAAGDKHENNDLKKIATNLTPPVGCAIELKSPPGSIIPADVQIVSCEIKPQGTGSVPSTSVTSSIPLIKMTTCKSTSETSSCSSLSGNPTPIFNVKDEKTAEKSKKITFSVGCSKSSTTAASAGCGKSEKSGPQSAQGGAPTGGSKGGDSNNEAGLSKCAGCGGPSGSALHPAGARGRHKYEAEVEEGVNCQILAELSASYAYLSMACFFGNMQVALPGLSGYFFNMYEEEQGHAKMFINYQNMRGGKVKLHPISAPDVDDWGCAIKALEVALEMEKLVKDKLIALHDLGTKYNDLSLMDFITTNFMKEQDESISELARMLTRANKMGICGCTEYLFDKEIFKNYVRLQKECNNNHIKYN